MFVFPLHIFCPGVFSADIAAKVIDGGTAINGDTTAIQTDGGGRWEGSVGEIDLDDAYLMRLWEAWSPLLSGARAFLMPVPMIDTAPAPFNGKEPAWPSDIQSDDDYFPTEVKFAQPWIEAVTVGDAPLRATTITINIVRGSRLTPGMRFGVGTRSCKIERIVSRNEQQATCNISTPLRAPIAAGSALNFDWPVVQCKGVIGQNLRPEYSMGFASIGFSFVEDFSNA